MTAFGQKRSCDIRNRICPDASDAIFGSATDLSCMYIHEMEELKKLDALSSMDEIHALIGGITGKVPDLAKRHAYIELITMHDGVPEVIRGQFNVARNMALYQYFMYSLAPEVQFKTYTIIEHALRLRNDRSK